MEVFNFILSVLTAVSAAFIVAEEYVFGWLRNFVIRRIKWEWAVTLVHCPVCLSWWIGAGVGLLVCGVDWIVLAVAFVSALTARIVKMLES